MKFTKKEYNRYVADLAPKSPLAKDLVCSFCIGGLICALGQLSLNGWKLAGLDADSAGTIVPITGFANSVVSPAIEFKAEGFITGMAAKMFVIAGPVIVYGTVASVVYGLILMIFGLA